MSSSLRTSQILPIPHIHHIFYIPSLQRLSFIFIMSLHYFSLFLLISTLATNSIASFQSHLELLHHESNPVKDCLHCESWRLSEETNNAGPWKTIPSACVAYVAKYMNSKKYYWDSEMIRSEAIDFAARVEVGLDGKDIWVFDIDETLLSNLPYYRRNGYGSTSFNETSFNAWVNLGKAPALPASLKLYKELQGLGFQIVLLTGRVEEQRQVTEQNLLFAGYYSWERLFLRGPSDHGTSAVAYKSKKRAELVALGYRIHGCSGDQWSDLIGMPMATRLFKLSNPMYYIP